MHSTPDLKLTGTINDPLDKVELRLYVDADFAGSREDTKSTSGGFLALAGENTFFPLSWVSKKQTSTSKSTAESELVSLSANLFDEGIPMLNFWQTVSGRTIPLRIKEDNEATIKIAKKGFSPKLRSLSRTHRVNLGSIHEEITKPDVHLDHCPTDEQVADIFTKNIDPQKWRHALDLLHMFVLSSK
jgi:histone deacetylase 1/2